MTKVQYIDVVKGHGEVMLGQPEDKFLRNALGLPNMVGNKP